VDGRVGDALQAAEHLDGRCGVRHMARKFNGRIP
jgi:hypothetical protein